MKMRKRTQRVGQFHGMRLPDVDIANLVESALARGGGQGNRKRAPSVRDSTVLMVHGGPDDGAAVPILGPNVTMGCFPDDDIVTEGTGVSGRHAEILGTNDGHFLRCLHTSNATFVNRRAIGSMKYLLRHGDRIQLAYSTVNHVFAAGNSGLVKASPGFSYEEILDKSDGFGEPPDPSRIHDPDSTDGYRINGLGRNPEGVEPHPNPEVYEGTVRLNVELGSQVRLVVSFVTELRLNSHLRMLRLVANSPESVDIWLALREPLKLKQILAQMEEVAEVRGSPQSAATQLDQENALDVRLVGELGLNSLTHRFAKTRKF